MRVPALRPYLVLALALALAAPLASARPASAQTARHTQPASERPLDDTLQGAAKDAYTSAKILFNNNDFEGAGTKYGQAYDLSKDPRLLFNLAICEKNLRHYARTQSLLQQYEHEMGARITADDRSTVDAALAAIKNLVGTVTVAVSEPGAAVLVDGQAVGTAPLAAPLLLDLGTHAVRVKKEGFSTSEQTVVVSGGNETAIAVTLAEVPHTAQLLVLTEPGAMVTVDEKAVSKGRFDGKVASGVHTVVVTESGKVPYKAEFDLKDGETRSVNVTLTSEKRGVPWGWIVGGAAVVAAGAGVGGYFLFKPTQPEAARPPDQLGSYTLSARRPR
jgi:hypothetical protein